MTHSKVGNLGVVVLEDWLVKSPPFAKLHNIQSWRRRYFALLQIHHQNQYTLRKKLSKKGPKSVENLHDMYLVYWEKKSDREKGVKPIRTIPLQKGYTVEMCQPPCFETKFHHVLLLDTVERKYYLCAEDEEKKQNWHDALLQAIESGKEAQCTKEEDNKEPLHEVIQSLLKETSDTQSLSSQSSSSSNRLSSFSSVSDITDFERRRTLLSMTQTPSFESPTSDSESCCEAMIPPYKSIPKDNILHKTRSLPPPPRHRKAVKSEKSFKCICSTEVGELVEEISPVMNFEEPIYQEVKSHKSINECPAIDVGNKTTVQFFDFEIKIPAISTIDFSNNTLRVTMPNCTYVVSMNRTRGVSFT